ncbi:MAG: hypothetical protein R2713_14705 [Ilumatobacteraceae bacterium]
MIAIKQGGTTGAGPGRGLNKLGDFLPLGAQQTSSSRSWPRSSA